MKALDAIFLWIGSNFKMEIYLVVTKIQGILWSIADIVLIFFFLKITDFIRSKTQKEGQVWGYMLLWLSALLTPFLLITKTSRQFFLLESIICGIQYSLLLYTLIVERKRMIGFFKDRIRPL